jgi:uncharacterized delta-60 repeat protein
LDTGFGRSGIVLTNVTNEGYEEVWKVSVQPDGKIVVAARIYTARTHHVVLIRYNEDGFLDQSFGIAGKLIFETFYDRASGDLAFLPGGLVVQNDGKLVAAGVASYSEDPFADQTTGVLSLTRYKVDGSYDETFGSSGKVTSDLSPDADWPGGLAIQSDGKIVVTVTTRAMTFGADFGVARYNKDGSLDTSFGVSGIVTIDLSGTADWAAGLEILPNGKILALGSAGTHFALVRYNHDGSMDATFGISGIVISDLLGSNSTRSIALQSDGKILVLGTATTGAPLWLNESSFVARYTDSGELDMTFGTDGFTRLPSSVSAKMRIQNDGNIVVGGGTLQSFWYSPRDFVVFRLLNSDIPKTIEFRIDSEDVAIGRSFTATISGSNLNDETYFDIRFIAPNSNIEQVALNWQRGISSSHPVVIGTAVGTWQVTGIRPHEEESDNTGEFVSVSAVLNVN